MITLEQLQTLDYVKIGLVGDNTQSQTEKQIEFSSEDVLSFAQSCKLEEKYVEEKDLLPVYLRLSQAEDNLNLKKMKN